MERIKILLASIILFSMQFNVLSQTQDSVKNYWISPIEVTAQRSIMAEANMDPSKDRLSGIFESNGFTLIRKGVFFAQDIYSDGFKKADINIVVDNERYHTACPNRMDSPLIRVNPIDIKSVELNKTNGNLLSGLGGVVNFTRAEPTKDLHYKTGISGSMGASQNIDAAFKVSGSMHSATFRYSTGLPYEDADGRTFKDLYGYKDNFKYSLFETSFLGGTGKSEYGASYIHTTDVSFPYLMMDERLNSVYSAFFSYANNKVYFNYTNHLMDNEMRVSPMTMTTDARNFTIGAVGDFYEVYYRNWDSDNRFFNNAGLNINNHLMPNTKTFSAVAQHQIEFSKIRVSGRLGAANQSMNDAESEAFFEQYYDVDKFNKWFPVFGLTADYSGLILDDLGYGVLIETGREAPNLEELYISVVKPGAKPNWSGNPNLSQPIRGALRGMLAYQNLNLELYYSHIWDYANLTKIMSDKAVQTYKNVDAKIMGVNLNYKSYYFDFGMSYTYGQNLTHDTPLAEIRPLEIHGKVRSSKYWNTNLFIKAVYEAEQTRVDEILKEETTPSWYRIDIGVKYELDNLMLRLEFENITNQLYYKHLSYSRNPFATGAKVFEPGRRIYMSLSYSI